MNAPPPDILELELDKHAKKVGVTIPHVAGETDRLRSSCVMLTWRWFVVDHAKKALELVPRAEWELPSQFEGSRVVLLVSKRSSPFVFS